MKKILIQIVVFFILLVQMGCTQIGNAFGNINFYSDDEERSIGSQYAYQIEQEINLYNDKVIERYINDLGQRLVKYSKRSNIPYRFKVVNDPAINAFAIPGGYCYVNLGLIQLADTESELAGVIAHEVGHVVGKHGMEQMSKQTGLGFISQIFLGPNTGFTEQIIANMISNGLLLKYGRGAELEADKLAIEEMHAAGINPVGVINFFEKLAEKEKVNNSDVARLMSTHPPTNDRIKYAKKHIKNLPNKKYDSMRSIEFDRIKNRLSK
tara:strand:- start:83 stop:883 length:801 start_codon:yes stop_codon:yes gene_type:complete